MKRLPPAAHMFAALLTGQEFRLGSRAGDFAIRDARGNSVEVSKLRGGVTVITFIATQRPVTRG